LDRWVISRGRKVGSSTMRVTLRKFGITAVTAIAVAAASIALPSAASARWGGGWHGGGWGWGGFGWGLGTGLLLGAAAAPYYYGGYYGYGANPYYYGYGPGCSITRRWVWDGYGHRVLRRVQVCY